MKSLSSVALIALLLPSSAALAESAWKYKSADPAKQVQVASAATGSAGAQESAKPVAQAQVQAEAAVEQPVVTTDQAPQEAKQASAAAVTAATGRIAPPPAGKGQIVFFRPSKFVGGAVGYKVREGATELGKLRSGKYFVVAVEPGAHEYTVHSEAKDILNLEVEAGETYYVQGTITMGILAGRPNLSPSTQEAFEAIADKLKLAQ